ncbi:2-keto-3-deoxy-L-fuconate dehydrogenase [Mycobacterium simulans]|nr:2-keto-3-deoxy-L-fuconate dehydrogenase [Mycobacterium simulans]
MICASAASVVMSLPQPIARTPNMLGNPEDVTNAVVWLAADEAVYITGQAHAVDGGWTAQ